MKLGRVIARRRLTRGKHSRAPVDVEIGQPYRVDRLEYCCPFRITGVGDDRVRGAYGVDAVQAMQLVSQAIASHLFRHGELRWLGGKDTGFPPADRSLPREWARATDQASTAQPDEPLDAPGLWPPVEFYIGATSPRRTYLFTKVWLPRLWLRAGTYPEGTDAIVHYGIPSPRHCAILRHRARDTGNLMRFVGDLDPLDLSVFTTLETGGAPLRSRPLPRVPTAYWGIDDGWVAMCEQNLRDGGLGNLLIRQDAAERKLLRALQDVGLDIARVTGPRCAEILRSGFKLEIEGATHPALYSRGFTAKVRARLLRQRARQAPGYRVRATASRA